MRIVAGRHRGRPLAGPAGQETRPTSALTRESVFNILAHGKFAADGDPIQDAVVLDGFAGSGANGLEALSRGAGHVVFMESQAPALAALRENLKTLGEQASATVIHGDCLHPPRATRACELVLLDPPYRQGMGGPALEALWTAGWIAADALCAVELMKTEDLAVPEPFAELDTRKYGKAKVVFLQAPGR
jgi:16S rRNA (guanine966-N2)-methyltransferase